MMQNIKTIKVIKLLEDINTSTPNVSKFWTGVKSLNGQNNNQHLKHKLVYGNRHAYNDDDMCELYADYLFDTFQTPESPHFDDEIKAQIDGCMTHIAYTATEVEAQHPLNKPMTTNDIDTILKKLNTRKAAGSDQISNLI